MKNIIDTHSHLYAEQFNEDRDLVIQSLVNAGVSKVLLPNIDLDSIEGINQLVAQDAKMFYRMIGLHPCSVKEDYKEVLGVLNSVLQNEPNIAVGEIGIDLYWDKSTKKIQEEAFLIQIQWALDYNLPIVIHSRESIDLIVDLIKINFGKTNLTGVFHCFTGTEQQASNIIDLGFKMGIGGVVTFKNSNLRNVLQSIPMGELVVETDSPYLAPVPYRGKRNESSYVVEVIRELSVIYGKEMQEVADITTSNALKLFKL